MKGKSAPVALAWSDPEYSCFQCGGPIAEALARCGSLHCHDCRDGGRGYEQGVDAPFARTPPKQRSSSLAVERLEVDAEVLAGNATA